MLCKAGQEEFKKYIGYAYELSLDLSKSSFPVYTDGIKTKNNFRESSLRTLNSRDSEILLYSEGGEILGWIEYYCIEEDKYVGIKVFNTERNTAKALTEFIGYIKSRYKGSAIYFGFPEDNKEALNYFEFQNIHCTEQSAVFTKNFEDHCLNAGMDDEKYLKNLYQKYSVKRVTEDNYKDFKVLHDNRKDMYWNSERLYEGIKGKTKNPWIIYSLYDKKSICASVYFTYYRKVEKGLMEIFGFDYRDEIFNSEAMEILLKTAMIKSDRDSIGYMTYFAGEDEVPVCRKLLLNFVTNYRLFKVTV